MEKRHGCIGVTSWLSLVQACRSKALLIFHIADNRNAHADGLLSDLAGEPNEIRCIVEVGSSKYNFSIARSNFDEVTAEYDAYLSSKAEAHHAEVDSRSFSEAFDKLSSDNNNEACANVRIHITDHASELEILKQSDIGKLFPERHTIYAVYKKL